MKTKKSTLLLAGIMVISMLLTEIASAAPEMFILEIQASGKGYEAVSDDAIVYTESKHKLDKFPLYALCDRSNGEMILAYYVAWDNGWSSTIISDMIETEKSLLLNIPGIITIYVDSNALQVYSSGAMSVQFNEKEGTVTSAKLKSLAMSYWQTGQYGAAGNLQRFGALKMKGKMVDWDELPDDVQAIFD